MQHIVIQEMENSLFEWKRLGYREKPLMSLGMIANDVQDLLMKGEPFRLEFNTLK